MIIIKYYYYVTFKYCRGGTVEIGVFSYSSPYY